MLIVLFLFVGNFITLLILLLNRQMRTIPNMFLASLAIADFCLGVFIGFPLSLPILVTSQWPFNDATCQFQAYIAIILASASIHTLTLMAVNRYFRIVRPAKYRLFFTKKKTTIMIFVLWFYSMCFPLPYFVSGFKMVFHPSKFVCFPQIERREYTACGVIAYVAIPTCVIFYCYMRIFKTVRSHNNNFQSSGTATSTVNVEEIKVARTLFIILVFFNLCWTPVLLVDIIDTVFVRWTFPREVYVTYSFLATLNSALNPLLYGVLNKNFRKEYLKILRCSYCRSQAIVAPVFIVQSGTGKLTTTSKKN